jgi:divalent metal cation (Fe/Co/Zn/Cd) transporter
MIWILVISIAIKAGMWAYNMQIAKIINSTALKAVAIDSISDVAATSCVLIGTIIFKVSGINLDGYMGLAVACFIIYTGIRAARENSSPIIGESPPVELAYSIIDEVTKYEHIIGVHDLMIHNYGVNSYVISLHAEVPCEMDVIDAHELIDEIENHLKERFKCHATIHMDPVVTNDPETTAVRAKVEEIIKSVAPELSMHDFRKTKGKNQENLIFDVAVPFGFNMHDDEVARLIKGKIMEENSHYNAVIQIDKISL